MAWKEEGGGGEDPSKGEETDTLLSEGEPPESPAPLNRVGVASVSHEGCEETETRPLVAESRDPIGRGDETTPSRQSTAANRSNKKLSSSNATPTKGRATPPLPCISSVPIMVTIDPSDGVSLNTGAFICH